MSRAEKFTIQLDMADGYLRENDPVGALQTLMAAQDLAADKTERGRLEHLRALAYFSKKEPEAALIAARKAAENLPDSPEAQNNLGRLLLDAGKGSEAEPWLIKAAANQVYRDAYRSNTNLGILYYRRGDDDRASVALKKATEQSPAGACVAYYYLGHLNLKENRYQEAVKNYDRATQKFCAAFVDAHLALGIAFERGKQFDKARRKFLEIRDGFPNTTASEQAMERLRHLP